MKLKRIVAGITACTIVGSTMLLMPVSAKTTTGVDEINITDLMNTAKMVAEMTDVVTPEKQAEMLDKFDTNGNGKISIDEILAIARRIARTDESDIVNEYGTADSGDTTETTETTVSTDDTTETTETTVSTDDTTDTTETTVSTDDTTDTTETTVSTDDTTETTETTVSTDETAEFAPVVKIGDKEYSNRDDIVVDANKVYAIEVTDEKNEITVSVTGSEDESGNSLVKVDGNSFEALADGTVTITITTADGREKTILIFVRVTKKLADVDLTDVYIGYNYNGYYMSEEYADFYSGIQELLFKYGQISEEDLKSYYDAIAGNIYAFFPIAGGEGLVIPYVGDEVELGEFFKSVSTESEEFVHYGIVDKVTFKSSDESKLSVSEDGKVVAKGVTTEPVKVSLIVDGEALGSFDVTVQNEASEKIVPETSESLLFRNVNDIAFEGKYVENVDSGVASTLDELKNTAGEENVNYVSFKKADGTAVKFTEDFINNAETIAQEKGFLIFIDQENTAIYYAITNITGEVTEVSVTLEDGENSQTLSVGFFDMEQDLKDYEDYLKEITSQDNTDNN